MFKLRQEVHADMSYHTAKILQRYLPAQIQQCEKALQCAGQYLPGVRGQSGTARKRFRAVAQILQRPVSGEVSSQEAAGATAQPCKAQTGVSKLWKRLSAGMGSRKPAEILQ